MSLHSRIQVATTDPKEGGEAPEEAGRTSVVADPFAELKTRVHKEIIPRLGPRLFNADGKAEADLEEKVNEVVTEILAVEKTPLTRQERQEIIRQITDDILGYGPLEPFLRDDSITEVMVNDHKTIYIERHGKITRTNAQFVDEAHLLRIIDKIISRIGRRIDESSPYVDARLPDGSRVNAIIPPLAVRGSSLTIRKFRRDPFTMADLIKFGTLTHKSGQFLEACVRGKLNILISGGTGSGKTTTLNVLSAAIPTDERIITVEDAAELQLKQEHVITLESRPANIEGKGQVTIRDLVRNTLRMRPDRIIVGECRGPEAVDMLQAMNTGHDGSLTTVHANNPRDALARTETLVLTAGVELPLRAIREQISSAFDLIVQVSRLVDGTRRITHVTEVLRMESDVIALQDIFIAKPVEDGAANQDAGHRLLGPLSCTGLKPHFLDKMASNGVNLPPNFFQDETGERASAPIFGRAVSDAPPQPAHAAARLRRRPRGGRAGGGVRAQPHDQARRHERVADGEGDGGDARSQPDARPAGGRERPDGRRRPPGGRRPLRGRARHRHLGEHEGPEAVRRDRRGDHVRAGYPVERFAGHLRLRLQAVHLRRAAGGRGHGGRRHLQPRHRPEAGHRHLRRR